MNYSARHFILGVFLSILIWMPTIGFSQKFPDSYFKSIAIADSFIINKQYKVAALHYDSVFNSYDGKGSWFNRYIAAYLWNMAGNVDSAFYHLQDIANEKSYYTISMALNNNDFKNLHNDVRWNELKVKIDSNKAYLEKVIPIGYNRIIKHGFEILQSQFAEENYMNALDSALMVLDADLSIISNLNMKRSALKTLKEVRIFLDWDTGFPNPQVHTNEDWLIQNGYIPEKIRQLDISNMRNYIKLRNQNQPFIILHEMAHAYHYTLTLEQSKKIRDTYLNAMQKNRYQNVNYAHGDGTFDNNVKAYAANNEFEYFAEITSAYFGVCSYFPFNRKDLKKYDKAGYKLVKALWVNEK